ncbi:MAG: cysteine--tRNA ligase [Pelagibacteraceae bacterium]|jgi:cysteinyl-tRNA synthetase|nr:cysteine--tRNA ligase [Pelagibacteraceae bacterium]
MTNLRISNSLTRSKDLFKPINPKKIGMYVCGPTVYANPHVGNGRSLVVFDLLFRVLVQLYGRENISYIRNITDVDDKIIEASKQKNTSIEKITTEVTNNFHQNTKELNCLVPTVEPKATEHIEDMIQMIKSLIEKKFAYVNEGHVYFRISEFKNYGKLSNKNLEELQVGSRVEISKLKKNPLDFILWKPALNDEPAWDSPWGRGRPGWHLECSVMSEKYLGKKFDIHGGGLDLLFPHHENEIAQSCSNNSNSILANYWIHNGFLTMKKEKMSKSLGNIETITDVLKRYSGQVIRLALLSAHYKQPLDWNENLLEQSKNTLQKWYELYDEKQNKVENNHTFSILLDDLNTPKYFAKLHELFSLATKGDKNKKNEFNEACRLIGIFNENKETLEKKKNISAKVNEKFILEQIEARIQARKSGNYKLADKIRNDLLKNGIIIEDKLNKTKWKYK